MIALPGMTNQRMDELLNEHAEIQEGRLGYWRAEFSGRMLLIITDDSHNRMRIITPVAKEDDLDDVAVRTALAANFDRALDARYAISDNYLWSAFIHPLRELSDQQFLDAMNQVATLADNFGSSFSSGNLVFGGG